MKNITIDKEKCVKCGLCISDCVSACIDFDEENYPKMQDGERCISCQHCLAICPTGALSFEDKNPENSEPIDKSTILGLIKSRKSIRQFKKEEISEENLNKIKEMLPYIPTGCNSHDLHFSIIEKREVMDIIREKTRNYILKTMSYKILSPIMNKFSRYKNAFLDGEDVIFRQAPHMIIVSSPITAPCANVDPIIALCYIELLANSLNLGTCWCGFAQICFKFFPELCEIAEIPMGYKPVYCMLLGIPAVNYKRTTQPKAYKISSIKDVKPPHNCIFCNIKRLIINFLR